MANKANRPNALALLLNYDSDSDRDSGYTSEEEKKRKHNFINPRERKSKKLKPSSEEEMVVDSEFCPHPEDGVRQDHISLFRNCLNLDIESRESNSSQKLNERRDLMPASHHNMPLSSQRLVPLPEEFMVSREHNDDPSLHQGRIRSFPHERGNWASMVFIPLTFGIFNPHLNSLLSVLMTTCQDHDLKMFQCQEYHISLSQTFILRLEWIQPFIEDLRRRLSKFGKFSTWLHSLAAFRNEEKTRTFLALRVGHGRNEMRDIAEAADASLKQYKLSSFQYEKWSFHVSVAWCHGDKVEELQKVVPLLQNVCDQYFDIESDMRTFDVSEIHVKTGNRIHLVPLRRS